MNEISKIESLKKELEKLKPLSSVNQQNLDKKLRLEFNYNTNHIEGNTLTYSETELLLIFGETKGNHDYREYAEMNGSNVAFQFIQELANEKERPLSEQIIKQLNQILLVSPFWKDAITEDGQTVRRQIKVGEYKEHPNSVRLQNGEIFHYSDPMETPALMTELIDWYREEEKKKELHPVELAALLHYKFVRIHPFDDGNGRVSRLLMNYVLFKNDFPPVVIKSENKKNYLSALNRADAGDLESFIQFISEQLIWSLELSIKAAKGESLDEPGDLDKKISQLKQRLNSTNKNVEITKSKTTILDIFNKSLEPLFLQVAEKLKEFDVLFKSSEEIYNYLQSHTNFRIVLNKLNIESTIKRENIDDIQFKYVFKHFRNQFLNVEISCTFTIIFHKNVYEIKLPENEININKLYHETISEEESSMIIEILGTSIYNQIIEKTGI